MPDNSKDDFYPSSIYGEKLIEVQNISWLHPEHPWHHQFCIMLENIDDADQEISDTVKLPAEFLSYSTYSTYSTYSIHNNQSNIEDRYIYNWSGEFRKHTRYK